MVDFTKLAATATRLVSANGRSVTFAQLDTTPADSSKPWRGDATPRTSYAATSSQTAVFVPPGGVQQLGLGFLKEELVERAQQIMILSATSDDLQDFDEVIDDDGSKWKIEFVEVLRPASTKVLNFVGVRR